MWEDKLSEKQIRGWRAVSAAGLQGKGLRKRSVFLSQTPVMIKKHGLAAVTQEMSEGSSANSAPKVSKHWEQLWLGKINDRCYII